MWGCSPKRIDTVFTVQCGSVLKCKSPQAVTMYARNLGRGN